MVENPLVPSSPGVALRTQLNAECELMIAYALSGGRELPQSIGDALDILDQNMPAQPPLAALTALHTSLSRLVAPATPRGLAAIRQDGAQNSFLHRFGAVPALRYLLLAAVGFSWVFFLTTLTQDINPENLARDIYTSSGWTAGLVMLFLLSAAGMGATFGALFEVYQYVSDGNYDPKYDSIYWVRIGIGLMAGLILAQLIPLPPRDPGTAALTRPLLALLGGYSASVLHRIMERLVAALESVFVPSQSRDPTAANRDLQQRVAEEQSRQVKMFDDLIGQVVAAGGNIGDVRSRLLTLLPGGLPSGLASKAERLALDAGVGLVTGGLAGAGGKIVSGLVSNAEDVAAAAVSEVLPASRLAGVTGTAIAGSVATLMTGAASPAANQGNGLSATGAVAGVAGAVSSLLIGEDKTDGPVKEVSAIDVAKTLGGGLLSGSPFGLVAALVTVGCQLGEAEYQRWTARVLAAPYQPEFLPPDTVNAASTIAAMRLSPIFGRVFKPEMEAGDRLKLQEIARCAAGPDAAFGTAFAARFASEEEREAGLDEFRHVLLDRQALHDASRLLEGSLSASDVLEAVDHARTDPAAAQGLTAVMQTVDRARAEKWDEPRTQAEVDARLQAPTNIGDQHA
jgi:hypothetical protein